MVTMYTQPGCAPCSAAGKRLDRAGIPYTAIDITVDESAATTLKNAGFTGTPVLSYAGELHTIAGLPGIIKAIKAA